MTDYSRGDYADLPAGTTDLENNYTAPDLTAIASNDNSTYAEQTANNEIAIHQYKKTVTGQYTNITWSGKSSLAPSESPVIMEVYNVTGTPAWEELDRDDSTAADTDFDIIVNNLATADYLDSGVITWRVYQAASVGTPVTKSIGEGNYPPGTPCDYTGCVDTNINQDNPTTNYGTDAQLVIAKNATGANILIKFSGLSNLSGITVSNVTLKFYIERGNQLNSEIWTMRRLLRDWVVGEATWNKWKSGDDSTNWSTAGALNDLDRNNLVASQGINLPLQPTGWITVTGDAQFIDDIQDMIDNTSTNYGWIIERTDANVGDGDYVLLESSNYGTPPLDYRPILIVEGTQ